MATDADIYNIIVLQPKGDREIYLHEQAVRETDEHLAEGTCTFRQCGQMVQEYNQKGLQDIACRTCRPKSDGECSRSNKLQKVGIGRDLKWKRIDRTDFKPFYDASPSRLYTYGIKAPSLKVPHAIAKDQDMPGAGPPRNLTQKLLRRENGQSSKNSQKQIQEKWCIFDKDQEHLSQYEQFEVTSRCHAVVRPVVSSIDAGKIWKRVSRAILNGKLPATNSCQKVSEDAVHVFYFANNQDLIDDFFANTFGRCVKLEKFG